MFWRSFLLTWRGKKPPTTPQQKPAWGRGCLSQDFAIGSIQQTARLNHVVPSGNLVWWGNGKKNVGLLGGSWAVFRGIQRCLLPHSIINDPIGYSWADPCSASSATLSALPLPWSPQRQLQLWRCLQLLLPWTLLVLLLCKAWLLCQMYLAFCRLPSPFCSVGPFKASLSSLSSFS